VAAAAQEQQRLVVARLLAALDYRMIKLADCCQPLMLV
jgi:hypothetical protein